MKIKRTTPRSRLRLLTWVLATVGTSLLLWACAGSPTPTAVPTVAPPAPGPTAIPLQAQPAIPAAVAGGPSAVASYNTWTYGGPGEVYVTYAAFLGGQSAQVTGKSEDGLWWAISVPVAPGGNGWVDGAWVTVSGVEGVPVLATPPVPPTAALVPPGPNDPLATALVNANVRSGPGETYPAYGVAPAGAVGRVIGKSEDGTWWAVRADPSLVGAGFGWVSASTVQTANVQDVSTLAAPPVPPAQAPAAPAEGAPTAIAADYVNLRSGPGSCHPAYAVAPPGAAGEVTGKSEDGQWWQVKLPVEVASTGLGWVSAPYVSTSNTQDVPVVQGEPCEDAGVPAPGTFECVLTGQSPADYSTLAPETDFDMQWTVVNTGTEPWTKNVGHLVQAGEAGTLHTGDESFALEDDVQKGEGLTVTVPAVAPASPGMYGELWEVNANGTVVCQFWIIVVVE